MTSPRVVKAAFVRFEADAPQGRVIAFQYNPETLHRTLSIADQVTQYKETIKFTLSLDASDALEHGDTTASSVGIYPALSALEMLLQPAENTGGFLTDLWSWITPRDRPFTLFVWGAHRVLPIRVLQLVIREQMFDATLNPIRASIDVTLETLGDAELNRIPRAKAIMDSHRSKIESLARQSGSTGSAADLLKDTSSQHG
jgi:hypothetical protein